MPKSVKATTRARPIPRLPSSRPRRSLT
jgi:hypothetical protein